MAKIVLGLGTSHGPLLSTPPEKWGMRGEDDKRMIHPFRGKSYKWDELVELRRDEHLEKQIELEVRQQRHADCRKAIDELARVYAEVKPDVALIFGNDQMEIFGNDQIPSFFVYYGEEIPSIPSTEEEKAKMPSISIAEWGHRPAEAKTYNALPSLATHVIKSLMAEEFDVSVSKQIPGGRRGKPNIPHAFGFIYEQIMKGQVIPNVPMFTNTFYPPNQPTAKRCFEMGNCVARAIESWDSDVRVAVFGSGGLTHFTIDETLDRGFLDMMKRKDREGMTSIPENIFQEGTSELKNWIPLASTMMHTGMDMTLLDYVPCYRTEGGTGNAMAFAYWR